MTVMQERAFEMIKRLPDDKVYYIVRMLEGIEGLIPENVMEVSTAEQKAYENLQRFRKCSDVEIDYKAELMQALEDKYEGID